MEKSPLDNTLDGLPKQEVGNGRHVFKTEIKEGIYDKAEFLIKNYEIDELDILKFLYPSGIGDRVIAYDDEKIVVEKSSGETIDKEIKKIADGLETTENPLIDNHKIKKICVEYFAQNFFMLFNGIMHNDIKPSHVLVSDKQDVSIIDFDMATILNRNNFSDYLLILNLTRIFETVGRADPAFSGTVKDLSSNDKIESVREICQPFLNIYKEIKSEGISLEERPKAVKKFIQENLKEVEMMLDSFKISLVIRNEIINRIFNMLDQYDSRKRITTLV